MSKFIPLSVPNFEGNERKYVDDAVTQGWVSTGGAYITQLEEKIADYVKMPAAVACQSGTSALHLSLMECGVSPGDIVIVPTLTFIAAVNPVRYQFADPVFMDCDESLCMDPVKLRAFCEQECEKKHEHLIYKKTGQTVKAVVVVHVFGNMADMEAIMDIAKDYHLKVIEDATEALGSRYTSGALIGKYAGTIGDFGAYSFNGNKIITTGGGGMVVAKNGDKLAHIKYISTQAKDDALFYEHHEVGFNYRMTNVQAALGVAQMELLDTFVERKNKNYNLYANRLAGNDKYELMEFRDGIYSNKWFYSLMIHKEMVAKNVRDIVCELTSQGVGTRPIWGLIHEQLPYRKCVAYEIEKAKYYSERIINIPCSTNLTEEEIDLVGMAIENVVE